MPAANVNFTLTTFEHFMLAQDTPEKSNTFVMTFRINGTFNRERLADAISQVLPLHPLTTSAIEDPSDRWCFAPLPHPLVDDLDPADSFQFDLSKESGIRLAIIDIADGVQELAVVVHHAVMDAIGTIHFIEDVAAAYSRLANGEPVNFSPHRKTEAASYLQRYRTSFGGNRLLHFLRWPFDAFAMLWSYEMLFNRPTPIESRESQDSLQSSGMDHGFKSKTLNEYESCNIREIAKQYRQTLNDHLLCCSFLSVEDWNREFNPGNLESLIRVMVAINLRRGKFCTACNMVSLVNVDRRPGRIKSHARFRKLLSLEMSAIKRSRLGVTVIRFLKLERLIRGRWPALESNSRCLASCVVSNVGDLSKLLKSDDGILRFGDSDVTDVGMVGQVRSNTNVCVHAFSYRDRLSVVVTYRKSKISEQQANWLLERIAEHLTTVPNQAE